VEGFKLESPLDIAVKADRDLKVQDQVWDEDVTVSILDIPLENPKASLQNQKNKITKTDKPLDVSPVFDIIYKGVSFPYEPAFNSTCNFQVDFEDDEIACYEWSEERETWICVKEEFYQILTPIEKGEIRYARVRL